MTKHIRSRPATEYDFLAKHKNHWVERDTLHGRRAIENVTLLTYAANRAYCSTLGDDSFKPWSDAEQWQLDSNRAGVMNLLDNPDTTPKESHESWMRMKTELGWVVGHVKDVEKKTHPCMVPYEQLPWLQRAKDYLFLGTARAALAAYGIRWARFEPWAAPDKLPEADRWSFRCSEENLNYGMGVIHGRINRVVAGALTGLLTGVGYPVLEPLAAITHELHLQTVSAIMATTPQKAYDLYRANKWPMQLPGWDVMPVLGDDQIGHRAHWSIMHELAQAILEIEGAKILGVRVQDDVRRSHSRMWYSYRLPIDEPDEKIDDYVEVEIKGAVEDADVPDVVADLLKKETP